MPIGKKSSGVIATTMLGRWMAPGKGHTPGSPAWPINEPNAMGEHLAQITAIWVDGDGNAKAVFTSPFGTSFEGWITHHRMLP